MFLFLLALIICTALRYRHHSSCHSLALGSDTAAINNLLADSAEALGNVCCNLLRGLGTGIEEPKFNPNYSKVRANAPSCADTTFVKYVLHPLPGRKFFDGGPDQLVSLLHCSLKRV